MKIKISENIKSLRKSHFLIQEQLAEALGVTVGAVYKWEAGLSMPEIKLIMELADFFEVSVDALLGYEQQNNNIESRIHRIKQCVLEKDFQEAVLESGKALKKYPNNFNIVYASAMMYMLKFSEDKCEDAMKKSNELFQNAISLLYQNMDKSINETTILNYIASNYLAAGLVDKGLEILKQNNICNINSSLIGYTYAVRLKQPEEARKYLIDSFCEIINNILRTMSGMAFMYTELNDETGMDAVVWLCDFLDSIKSSDAGIVFADKLKAVLLAQCAVWKANRGCIDEAREYARNAYSLAMQFDEEPIYTMQGIKFLKGEECERVSYDGIGKTAMESIENMVFKDRELSEAHEFVKHMWEELKNENVKG